MVSDAARLELLRRFGGTYLDLDSLTLRPLPAHDNYLARLLGDVISNAVLSFQPRHELVQKMVEDIPARWNLLKYTSIGADLLTHHLHLHCHNTSTSSTSTPKTCRDVTVFPGALFFPFVSGGEGMDIFAQDLGYGTEFVRSFAGYSLHLYNHLTERVAVDLSRESVVREVAVRHCPEVVKVLVQRGVYM
ncbi:alpha-1,4-N-acetylglucosaminyltransferase-like [Eriocheir sinensis]|uniref:alpha-1,4-N-acetylglucosaminyltransferase-like n=1 Tax=Eriocheir sinensis TaxID=95602 RepID=UPI0021C57E0E|nr:alpha-1,4-N-acetylglucosaminyltransferase-like [Eriocheir sinensis]